MTSTAGNTVQCTKTTTNQVHSYDVIARAEKGRAGGV